MVCPCSTVYCGTLKYLRHVERRVQIPWHVHAVQYTVACRRSVQSIVTCRCGLYFVVICRIVSAVVDTTLNDGFAVIINERKLRQSNVEAVVHNDPVKVEAGKTISLRHC